MSLNLKTEVKQYVPRNLLIFRNIQVTKIDQRIKIGVSSRSICRDFFLKFQLIDNPYTHCSVVKKKIQNHPIL